MTTILTDHTLHTLNGKKLWIRPRDLNAVEVISKANSGGFATVKGYKPTTDYVTPPTVDINFISRFSTERLYERKLKALKELSFNDVSLDHPKLKALSSNEAMALFASCIGKMVESMDKSLKGVRDDAHRIAHDTFYFGFAAGAKLHFMTEKGNLGGKELVLVNGHPVVESVMVSIIEISRKVVQEGVYKTTNSGEKVLMDNAINKALKSKTVSMKTISLKENNYEALNIGGESVSPEVEALMEMEA
jgi:hypothetical protein